MGESLSPQSAPLAIAPAVITGDMPRPEAIPKKAMPTVLIVPQDDPIIRAITVQIRQVRK